MRIGNINIDHRFFLSVLFLAFVQVVSARCGETRYSWGADALHEAAVYILSIMEYVVGILYVIASLTALYSATSIYIKLMSGEEGFVKSLMVLIGAILFLIGATIVMPAIFGINWSGDSWG